jgi:hypothetical protein
MGQKRRLASLPAISGLPPPTGIIRPARYVSKVRILLQKSFWDDERNFLEPLMRSECGDVRSSLFRTKTTTDLRIGATERCSGRAV